MFEELITRLLGYFKLNEPTNAPARLFNYIKAEKKRRVSRDFDAKCAFLAERSKVERISWFLNSKWKICKIISTRYRNSREFEGAYNHEVEQVRQGRQEEVEIARKRYRQEQLEREQQKEAQSVQGDSSS